MNYYTMKRGRQGATPAVLRSKNSWKSKARKTAQLVIDGFGFISLQLFALILFLLRCLRTILLEKVATPCRIEYLKLKLKKDKQESPIPENYTDTCDNLDSLSSSSYHSISSGEEHDSGILWTESEENDSPDARNFPTSFSSGTCDNSIRIGSGTDYSSDEDSNEGIIQLLTQLEFLFSDEYLEKDGFLLKHVRRRPDGFVSLRLLAGLRKVKKICRDFNLILSTAKTSTKLEVNAEGTKVRRIEPLTQHLKSLVVPGLKINERNHASARHQGLSRRAYNNSNSSDSGQEESFGRPNLQQQRSLIGAQIIRHRGTSLEVPIPLSPSHPRQQSTHFGTIQAYTDQLSPRCHSPRSSPISQGYSEGTTSRSISPTGRKSPLSQTNHSSGNSSPINHTIYPDNRSCSVAPVNYPTPGPISAGQMNFVLGTTSLWLQRRHASSRNNFGVAIISQPLRQPRGPDGTVGFSAGYRERMREVRVARAVLQ